MSALGLLVSIMINRSINRLQITIPLFLVCTSIGFLLSASNLPICLVEAKDPDFLTAKLSSNLSDTVNLTLLHINDLHGWLNPRDGIGGVASYMSYFRQEGFDPAVENSSYLLLSGGDQNTGPATATLSKGMAVIDVMNAMGFDVACIGNHEFDYGVEWINNRKAQANFPILSCNIFDVNTTNLANFAVPWVIQNHSGVNVGIVGLTTTSTSTSSHPKITSKYDFSDPETELRKHTPDIWAAGADLIVVLAHMSPDSLTSLATDTSDLGISVFLGGHGGGGAVTHVGDSIIAAAAHKAQEYVKIDLTVNRSTGEVISSQGTRFDNDDGGLTPDSSIQTVVDQWDAIIDAEEVLTYTSEDIKDVNVYSGIAALVTDAFIYNFDYDYNFGITNRGGGFRDYFREGNISIADVVSVIPFENNLIVFNMTGEDLEQLNFFSGLAISGLRQIDSNYYIQEQGVFTPFNLTKTYTGLITDYSWYVDYQNDFNAFDTGIHYRDAVIAYFREVDDLALHDDVNRTLIPLVQLQPLQKLFHQPQK